MAETTKLFRLIKKGEYGWKSSQLKDVKVYSPVNSLERVYIGPPKTKLD